MQEEKKKNILIVIPFFGIYPPMNGGMLRCFNLLNQLCIHFNVTAIMHQDKSSFLAATNNYPSLINCSVISTAENKKRTDLFSLFPKKYADALRSRYWNRSLIGAASSHFLLLYPPLKKFVANNKVDYVILEDMSILNLAKVVKRYLPGTPIFYDAYNVNSILAKADLANGLISQNSFLSIEAAEKTVFKYADKVFACSENDLEQICRMNGGNIEGTVVPNGVEIPITSKMVGTRKEDEMYNILFCGSLDYSPNREGLSWFCKNVLQLILNEIPEAKLLVVGKGDPGEELSALLLHPAIINHGRVEKVDNYYHQSVVAIVPLLSGSGTRLKLMEAMAFKVPVVATKIGAEGIDYTDGKDIIIADIATDFATGVIKLLQQPLLANQLLDNAFLLVENKYDWNIIGDQMAHYLNGVK